LPANRRKVGREPFSFCASTVHVTYQFRADRLFYRCTPRSGSVTPVCPSATLIKGLRRREWRWGALAIVPWSGLFRIGSRRGLAESRKMAPRDRLWAVARCGTEFPRALLVASFAPKQTSCESHTRLGNGSREARARSHKVGLGGGAGIEDPSCRI
jgi:hypothetical protein